MKHHRWLVAGCLLAGVLACAQAQQPAPPPALTAGSQVQPGVAQGKLSEKRNLTSSVYDGMVSNDWVYVPAAYDPARPAALMVFQDGGGYLHRLDDLIGQGKIPMTPARGTVQFTLQETQTWQ